MYHHWFPWGLILRLGSLVLYCQIELRCIVFATLIREQKFGATKVLSISMLHELRCNPNRGRYGK
ncbi:uncharacterized protein RSE6_14338 [Rhynchosporium secalis]|uniref:Uncharacterized protein n=1 Tax=Rhynchosporium secalis TaxID=38038 RepID=A0A1E1MV31_RHYSE|nr:uncharacterized protein RSE6_14338 [Rhynchosporium secalis]